MPTKMDKSTLIYGPVDCDKLTWAGVTRSLNKRFKTKRFGMSHVKGQLEKTFNKHKGKKGAYAKIGKIGKQYVFRIKTAGILKSTHLVDVVAIENIDDTEKLILCADTEFKVLMYDKSIRDIFRAYLHKGASTNEMAFWEVTGAPALTEKLRKKIYELYVSDKGKHMVNINSKIRKALKAEAAESKFATMDFTAARDDVFKMLKKGHGDFLAQLTSYCCNKFWNGPVVIKPGTS